MTTRQVVNEHPKGGLKFHLSLADLRTYVSLQRKCVRMTFTIELLTKSCSATALSDSFADFSCNTWWQLSSKHGQCCVVTIAGTKLIFSCCSCNIVELCDGW